MFQETVRMDPVEGDRVVRPQFVCTRCTIRHSLFTSKRSAYNAIARLRRVDAVTARHDAYHHLNVHQSDSSRLPTISTKTETPFKPGEQQYHLSHLGQRICKSAFCSIVQLSRGTVNLLNMEVAIGLFVDKFPRYN